MFQSPTLLKSNHMWQNSPEWEVASTVVLVLRWEDRAKGCALGLKVGRLGPLRWEASHSPLLPTDVDCTWTYGVFTVVGKGWLQRVGMGAEVRVGWGMMGGQCWAAEWILGDKNPGSGYRLTNRQIPHLFVDWPDFYLFYILTVISPPCFPSSPSLLPPPPLTLPPHLLPCSLFIFKKGVELGGWEVERSLGERNHDHNILYKVFCSVKEKKSVHCL